MIALAAVSWLRVASATVLVIALATSHLWAYSKGQHQVQLQWDADTAQRTAAALVAEQQARATEQQMQDKIRRVTHDYQTERSRRAAADSAAADSLRRLQAALAADRGAPGTDTAASARADDDPRDGIIAECAGALAQVDGRYRALASQTAALQRYAADVCLTPQQ